MPIDASSEFISTQVNAPMSKSPLVGSKPARERKLSAAAARRPRKADKGTQGQDKQKSIGRRDKTPKVPRFVRHSPIAIELDNLLVQRVDNFLLPIEKKPYSISFISPVSNNQFNSCLAFDFNFDGLECSFEIDKRAATGLFSDLLSIDNLNDLPDDLLIAVAEAALDDLIKYFEGALNKSISIEGVRFGGGLEKNLSSKFFSIMQDGVGKGVVCLNSSEDIDSLLIESLKKLPVLSGGTDFLGDVQTSMHVELGVVLLSSQQAGELSSGDILIMDNFQMDESVNIGVRIEPNLVVRGTLSEDRVVITTLPEAEMENIAIHDEMSSEPAHLEDLQIKLLFEIGDKAIPIKDLKSVKPGYTFELDSKMETPVRIRANGHVMGVGQLVRVGDRVGVRILELVNGATG